MATNYNFDPTLLDLTILVSGARSKEAVVTTALEEFIAGRQQGCVSELIVKFEWDDSFGHKAERSRQRASLP